jgi:hypothetical protein
MKLMTQSVILIHVANYSQYPNMYKVDWNGAKMPKHGRAYVSTCSQEYFTSRGLGKLSRLTALPDDVAQNRGGSQNFIDTKDYIVSCI